MQNSVPLYCPATADRWTSLGPVPEGQYPQCLQLTSGGRMNFRTKLAATTECTIVAALISCAIFGGALLGTVIPIALCHFDMLQKS